LKGLNIMNKKKKEYKKPELNVVELATEEVLAAGCKFDGASGGPGYSGSCKSGLSLCNQDGS
jgi:hypothetical protein